MDKKTILIIEDDEMNMRLIRSVLQLGKCRILEAESAEKGIQLAREHRPDLILMDIRLPGMNGLEATRVIKDDPDFIGMPIAALISYDNEEDSGKTINTGCPAFLPKPIDTICFRKTIVMILWAYSPMYFQ